MDYGEKHHFEDPRNNLNLENWAPEHSRQNIGNRALVFGESPSEEQESSDGGQNLRENTNFAADSVQNNATAMSPQKAPAGLENLQFIIGDRFNSDVVAKINLAENELSQTGDIDNFYEKIRTMSEIATEKWAA